MSKTIAGNKGASVSPKGMVPAVLRTTQLLNVLAAAEKPLSLAAVTERLGLPKSSVHGLCATLVEAGYAMRFQDGTYHLGVRVMDLAHGFLARTDLTMEFVKILEESKPLPEESIVLSVLDGADVVYIGCRNGTRAFGFNFRFGMRLPANCAASGKALLSTLPPERIEELVRSNAFCRLTNNSITKLKPLMVELNKVREQGYAMDDEETRPGMVCFGAPVFSTSSRDAIAAVGVSMSKAIVDQVQSDYVIGVIKEIAATLSRRLGYQSAT